MLSQYFAQYLLNKRLLSANQVRELLEEEQGHRVKLGVIAMNQGLMNAEQVAFVHQLQVRFDKRFGEVAVDEGFLTEEQLDKLLKTQESGNLNFGQAALNKKFMTLAQLEDALREYNNDNKLAVNQAIHEIEIAKIDFSEIEEAKELYSEYVDLFLRALLRFMDTPSIILPEQQEAQGTTWLISQRMTGEVGLTTGLQLSEEVLLEMARRYSQEELEEVDDLAVDSVAEFLNVVNGLFIVNLSNRHVEIDLEPQKCGKDVHPLGNKRVVILLETNFGEVRLIVAADEMQ